MCLDNKAIQLLQAINQLIDRAVTNNAIQSTGTVVLPACIRLLFPLLHAEKIRRTFSAWRTFSACNKGNRRRLRVSKLCGFSRIFFIRRRLLACLSHIRIYNGLIIVGRSCKRFISLRDLGEHKFEPSLRKSISRTATFRRFERDEIGFISYLQAPDHFWGMSNESTEEERMRK